MMARCIFILFLSFLSTGSFAADLASFKGTVVSLSAGNPDSGTQPSVVVVDEAGQRLNFLIVDDVRITDMNDAPLTLADVKPEAKVDVGYNTLTYASKSTTSANGKKVSYNRMVWQARSIRVE